MKNLARFGVSMEEELLARFDRLIKKKGYANRSEAIRDLVRETLIANRWQEKGRQVVGTLTLVYDHHTRELSELLTSLQHDHYADIPSTLHVHLDRDTCLEVLVIKGKSEFVRKLADRLTSVRGVKHGKLAMTAAGKGL